MDSNQKTSQPDAERIMQVADEMVGFLGRKFPFPRPAVTATALVLGRLCHAHGVSLEQALVLAKAVEVAHL